jgi:hypothetical protein
MRGPRMVVNRFARARVKGVFRGGGVSNYHVAGIEGDEG